MGRQGRLGIIARGGRNADFFQGAFPTSDLRKGGTLQDLGGKREFAMQESDGLGRTERIPERPMGIKPGKNDVRMDGNSQSLKIEEESSKKSA